MGNTTPNIGIFIPANGETIYGDSFAAGMRNIDDHDHSGGPNKGAPLTGASISDFSITFEKLNANVADTTTGIGVSATTPNKLEMLGLLKNIYQLATATGFLAKNGSVATARTITGTANQIAVANGDGAAGNPTLSLPANVLNTQQTCFNVGVNIAAPQNAVTGDGTTYTVLFPSTSFTGEFQQGSSFASPTFTAPVTGNYLFTTYLRLGGINSGASNSSEIALLINGTDQYVLFYCDSLAVRANNRFNFGGSQILRLTAGATVVVTLRVSDGGAVKYINIVDGNFSGVLLN